MMDRWTLPKTLNVGGKDYPIRYQYHAVLSVLSAYSDPELEPDEKQEIMLTIMFPNASEIPREHIADAIQKASEFIDCGQKDDGKPKPRVMDWNQDADIIIPAINKVAGMEVRANPDLHWWTFWGYFLSIGAGRKRRYISGRKKSGKNPR